MLDSHGPGAQHVVNSNLVIWIRTGTVGLVGTIEVSSWEVAGLILVSVCCQEG
jgi:hypothetical protein